MKDSNDKRLDRLSRNIMEAAELQQPSFDFTKNVLQSIEALHRSSVTIYKPLISKSVWFGIGALIIAIFAMVLFLNTESTASWFVKTNRFLSRLDFKDSFTDLRLSPFSGYALFIFMGMVLLQFWFVKRYLARRFKH